MLILSALLSLLDVPTDDPEWLRIDPPQRRERTLDAIKRLLLRESQAQPVCLVVENLHWIDSETQTLLDRLIESLPTANLLMLVNYRPEYQHGWGNKSYYAQMRLAPLPADSAQDLLSAVLGDAAELEALKNLLIDHTGGNPFFLEEIVRTLIETEVLVGNTGSYSLIKTLPTIKVPDTVQAVLSARLDRLGADDKHLLQSASVIGMDVPYKLLADIIDTPAEKLPSSLANLQTTEFLYESNLFPEIEYTFRHALTQEVVYGSLLNEQRRELHARIADAIERLYADRLSEQVDRLADHTFQGGQWERAIKYLRDVSNKTAERSAYQEAASSLERALEAVSHLPDGQEKLQLGIDIRFGLRSTLQPLGEHDRVSAYLREAEKLTLELEDQGRLGWASSYLCQYLWWERDAQRAEEMGQRALSIASKLDDLALEAATNFFLGQGYFNVGIYTRTIEQCQRNVALLTGEHAHDRLGLTGLPSVLSRIYLSWALAEQGRFSEASVIAEEAIAIAKAADQDYSLAAAYLGLGQIQTAQGAFSQAVPVLEGVTELCKNSRLPLIQQPTSAVLSLAYALAGRMTDALSIAEDGIPSGRNIGLFDTPMSIIASGTVYLMAGNSDKAEQVAVSAAQMVEQHGYRGNQARVAQLLGDICAGRSPPNLAKAKASYEKAISLAKELQMRPLIAQCDRRLGLLHTTTRCYEEADRCLTGALQLFREMDMAQWADRTEQELKAINDFR
jgi:predicted ATPase